MIFSGLDWSRSPGPAHGPHVVFTIVHIDQADLPTLENELARAAVRLGWPPHFVFKHSGAKPVVHREFYLALHRVPFTAHVSMLAKASWQAQYSGKGARGDDCLGDGMATLLLRCPDRLTSDQILYIDLPHKERATLTKYRAVIRSALVGAGR